MKPKDDIDYMFRGLKIKVKIAIHRLVALAFIGPRPENQEVRHLDGNPHNNHISNLCYGTRAENIADAINHKTFQKPKKLTSCNVIDICNKGKKGISAKLIADEYNICRNTVTEILRGDIWKHVTKDLTPISNLHYKFHLLTEGERNLICDLTKTTGQIGNMLGYNRHTILRWRKKLLSSS